MKKYIFLWSSLFLFWALISSCSNEVKEEQKMQADSNSDAILVENINEVEAIADTNQSEPVLKIETDFGQIKIKLYNGTPKHRENFLKLAQEGYFNGSLFHRIIPNFMIQGGDPDSKNAAPKVMLGNGGPGYTIPAEFMPEKYFHKRGALAAAREPDQVNPQKASSGSQFYIVQGQLFTDSILDLMENYYQKKFTPEQRKAYTTIGGAPHLDGAYSVFGEVIEGMDVVDKIAAQERDPNDRPIKDIKMNISIVEEK